MTYLNHLSDFIRWRYLLAGCVKRVVQPRQCPCCRSAESTTIDHKLIYRLEKCQGCRVRYRYPYESPEAMIRYYQHDYSANRVTLVANPPRTPKLKELMARNFSGCELDYHGVVALLRALGLKGGARVLDFGASWGYGVYQLKDGGFDARGYEISRPRAAVGATLGVDIMSDLAGQEGSFDAVYSSHVIEHLSNPRAALREQLRLTRPGGFVVAHTPNGSEAFRQCNFPLFHLTWGLVHPVLLSDEFVFAAVPSCPVFLSSSYSHRGLCHALAGWDQRSDLVGELRHAELLIVIHNVPKLRKRTSE